MFSKPKKTDMEQTPPITQPIISHVLFYELTDGKTKKKETWSKEKVEKARSIHNAANKAIQNSEQLAKASLPIVTGTGITMMGMRGDYMAPFAMLGFPVMVGGLVIDATKFIPVILSSAEEGLRGGILKLVALLFEKADTEDAETNRIFYSFLIRMNEAAEILTKLKLKTKEEVETIISSGNEDRMIELIGWTLLLTAYVSRHQNDGLLLASEKILTKENCPAVGIKIFDKIMDMKNLILDALKSANGQTRYPSNEARDRDEAEMTCKWISLIIKGKKITDQNKPNNVTDNEIILVNNVIKNIYSLGEVAIKNSPKSLEEVASKAKTVNQPKCVMF